MRLGELVSGWLDAGTAGGIELTGLTADSRDAQPGMVFVALPYIPRVGFRHDGHDFIADAVARGAVAVIAADRERALQAAGGLPVLVHDNPRWLLPRLAARWYGEASRQIRLAGVTGTNGKTTVCYLVDEGFRAAGHRTVLAGTVETRLADERRPATTTTPDPVSLQRLWREAVERGVTAGAMEVSSHALHQHRVDATCYTVAVITNVTQDHLDYHADMDEYFLAKARLFEPDETGHAPLAVVNADDPWCRRLLEQPLREPVTFGLDAPADVRAERVEFDARGARFRVVTPWGTWDQATRLVGRYNVSNALAALTAAVRVGVDPTVMAATLSVARGAPGRLEPVDMGQPYAVLVDYAHTPDALRNVLTTVREITAGKLICVFGCGGDRDRGKRPQMGRIATDHSDVVVVTSDNPRTEDPLAIIADIRTGIDPASNAKVLVEPDRAVAIGQALAAAEPGDAVLICGKGHEDYLLVGTEKLHFDDREVAADWLRQHG